MENRKIGILGENLATKYLEDKGYIIIGRNFECKQGEIDIIAQDKNEIVFVEVKTRTTFKYGKPVDAVTNVKQKHIEKSASFYIYKNNLEKSFIRLDVIEVYLYRTRYRINHIKQIK